MNTIVPENVTEIVVPGDMCVGCGVCAGVCPVQALQMKMKNGKYTPVLKGKCLPRCGMCLSSCPFFDHGDNQDDIAQGRFGQETGIQYDSVIGYYLNCYIGYSKTGSHREEGASGGMATWVLERLLKRGEIDCVVTVRPRMANRGPLFEMTVLTSVEDVRSAAGSRYYPVELSGPLHTIWSEQNDLRYAIVGVPCFLYGIRRAMNQNSRLNRRISYLLGLACGLYPTAQYTEVLSVWAGVAPSKVRTVGYRFKDGISMGWDYRFRAQGANGNWSRPVGQLETFRYLWGRYYFAHSSCLYCDDVFAEVADAVFADAWLPEYLSETRGNSIVVARHPRIASIFEEGNTEGTCTLLPCSINEVLASQESVIYQKREAIRKRVKVAREEKLWLPRMRVKPDDTLSESERRAIFELVRTVRASKMIWPYFRRLPPATLALFFGIVDTYAGGLRYGISTSLPLLSKHIRKWLSSLVPASLRIWRGR